MLEIRILGNAECQAKFLNKGNQNWLFSGAECYEAEGECVTNELEPPNQARPPFRLGASLLLVRVP